LAKIRFSVSNFAYSPPHVPMTSTYLSDLVERENHLFNPLPNLASSPMPPRYRMSPVSIGVGIEIPKLDCLTCPEKGFAAFSPVRLRTCDLNNCGTRENRRLCVATEFMRL